MLTPLCFPADANDIYMNGPALVGSCPAKETFAPAVLVDVPPVPEPTYLVVRRFLSAMMMTPKPDFPDCTFSS